MAQSSQSLRWMIDELLNFHDNKYNGKETGNKGICKLSRETICNVCGRLYFSGKPTWAFVLEDETCSIPCILINSASNVERLFRLVENIVVVRKAYLVAEKYTLRDGDKPMVWLQASVYDMFVIKDGPPSAVLPLDETHWNQRILVVHVSTPIIISSDHAYSLVLVMTSLPGSEQTRYLWIVLSGKQLQWNLFLIPNREYDIHMTCAKNYFEESIRPLRAVVGGLRGVSALVEILHHSTMWPTLDAVDLLPNTQISLQPTLNLHKFNCTWPAVWWMSIEEALAQEPSQMMFSIWGEVVRIYDDVEQRDRGGCSLCGLTRRSKHRKVEKSDGSNIKMADADFVYNPWETVLRIKEPLRVPTVPEEDEKQCFELSRMPESLTKNIMLKDPHSGREVCLYVKNWSQHHYAPVFTPGVILCARMVQKRVSSSKNAYFITCALSSFEVIGCGSSMSNIGGSNVKYGFPYKEFEPQTKVWGILDTWKLTKVTLSHTKNRNSNDLYFTASASLLVDRFSGNPVIVCLQDSHVRTLLNIPLDIWTHLIQLSRVAPIEYNPHDMQSEDMDNINSLFYAYCSLANAEKKRFHIVCRFLSKAGGEYNRDLYFCVNLCDADSSHLTNIKDVSTFHFSNLNFEI